MRRGAAARAIGAAEVRAAAPATVLTAVVCGALLSTGCTKKPSAVDSELRGMTYASIEKLPDFSGWWYWDLAPEDLPKLISSAPLKPKAAALIKEDVSRLNSGKGLPDPVATGQAPRGYNCLPPHFIGLTGGLADDIEFLFTPGRVTVADEGGLVRRISITPRPLPSGVDETNSGTSVGHWEGQTLVVETGGLDRKGRFVGPDPIGRQAHVVERISVTGPDTLEIVGRIIAPESLTRPCDYTVKYRRNRRHGFHEAVNCVENDRSIDPVTGRQRFDLTPPSDLPPPPGR